MRIAVELLGREVVCQHCEAHFVGGAEDDYLGDNQLDRPLMQRVEEILRRTSPNGLSPSLEVNEIY
jgi:hypothetical protein